MRGNLDADRHKVDFGISEKVRRVPVGCLRTESPGGTVGRRLAVRRHGREFQSPKLLNRKDVRFFRPSALHTDTDDPNA